MSIQRTKTLDLTSSDKEESKSNNVVEDEWGRLTLFSQINNDIYKLKENKITIGRNTENIICIPDKR